MIVLPPHLVVLGLKFAAGRLAHKAAHKGIEVGLDIATREYARHMTPEGEDPAKVEARAKTAVKRTRQAVKVARKIKPALRGRP
ncbi:hypothetical protein RGUI_0757 [Rhodovulum sp. P5]|uniref:hypothetical protein n=1 Tax=Rhodovulum sp. P5 TaxID=1564506 RepID=UPI0009C1E66D|nr:hypothetical protein [Rhodovulum sp. P5]ARE38898.1 hypothetical protein RGUI_0757 [Rhodovulum sp. P5]